MKAGSILVVEDNPITRKMMRFALESESYQVLEARDGAAALSIVAEKRPDMMLQDYILPDMDGVTLLDRVRALPGGADLPVLLITGMVSQLEEIRGRVRGPTSVIAKPLEPSRLVELVRTHLARGASTPGQGRRVLVVDDEPLGRKLATLRLLDAGFQVEAADSGEDALRKAAVSRPDAILSDVLMPGMDGFDLCQAVRNDAQLARVPVVLLSSAFVEEADQQLARETGANALLVRTPDMRTAIDALGRALQEGGPSFSAPGTEALALLHTERVKAQLQKQMARNEALLRQGAIQAAALSVVRGLALALASPRDVPSILADVLVHCLDAGGLSTGLLYLSGADGRLRLQAQAGVRSGAREAAADCFGHPEILRRALEAGEPAAYVFGAEEPDRGVREVGEGLGQASALMVPFIVGEERVGVLVLAADSQDLSEPVWLGFARALAVQFGQTIALGRSISRGVASEARYRSLMEEANDAILLVNESAIVEANRQAEALLGRPRAEIVGRSYEEFVLPEERETGDKGPVSLLAEGTTHGALRHLRQADGSSVSVEVSTSVVRIDEELLGLLILRDVTERERADQRLRQSEEQYRLLFEGNRHPMSIHDPASLGFLAVNEAAVRLYGYPREEFLAMTIRDLKPEKVGDPRASSSSDGTWKHRKKDGSAVVVEISSNATVFQGRPAQLVLATDITEKMGLEAQLMQAQKMEAVGRLAGGVAHDFNNLLGVITGYAQLLHANLGPDHPGHPRLEQIQKAADRATALTRQLLAFSRKEVVQPKVLDLSEVVADAEKMLQRLIGEDVQLKVKLESGLGRVLADRGQIDQVILNLAVNARDAMARGGDLILETANTVLDVGYTRNHPGLEPGRYVVLAVSDTGHGMDAATQSHIFEPFFTTKEEGKGTGLGLATVFGIVKQSGGHIGVYSEPGVGTTFKIYFPRIDKKPTETSTEAEGPPPLGTETILLVEDAEALREMVREILETGGYRVLEASDPQEALALAAEHAGSLDLVLTDVIMPRLSGPELVASLRQVRPGTRALFMSGYTNEAIGQRGVLPAGTRFLQKPFAFETLLRGVRAALDQTADAEVG